MSKVVIYVHFSGVSATIRTRSVVYNKIEQKVPTIILPPLLY